MHVAKLRCAFKFQECTRPGLQVRVGQLVRAASPTNAMIAFAVEMRSRTEVQ